MKIFVVSPVYNEQKRLNKFLDQIKQIRLPIIFVEDGSSDRSYQLIKNQKSKNITVLRHDINLGKGAALKTGCEYAFKNGAEAVVLMDSDGQHLVSDLDKFVKKLSNKECDIILGSRNFGLGVPLDRYLGNKVASVIIALAFGIYVSDLICGYRALTKNAYKKVRWDSVDYGVEVETVVRIKKTNIKYCEVPVEAVYYDSFKGVSILEAFGILLKLFKWKITI